MSPFIKLSRAIDWLNTLIGKYVIWLIFASTVISAVNAIVRKAFSISSNAYLEVQWYLFAASFMLAAGYTLLNNEHVRVDVVASRFSRRTQMIMDAIGFAVFLIPVCLVLIWFGTPVVVNAIQSGETSGNAGGLIRWPVYLVMPVGFTLLLLQGISEFIKRIAFLRGLIDDPTAKKDEKTAEEELAESIRRLAESKGVAPATK
ncbi:MAG: TRAP transporter small permease subunit [Comamonadaceae bacterium]|nr:MAG: TRAP transporter small permease subunit [Comamonadaceae bacterium]